MLVLLGGYCGGILGDIVDVILRRTNLHHICQIFNNLSHFECDWCQKCDGCKLMNNRAAGHQGSSSTPVIAASPIYVVNNVTANNALHCRFHTSHGDNNVTAVGETQLNNSQYVLHFKFHTSHNALQCVTSLTLSQRSYCLLL